MSFARKLGNGVQSRFCVAAFVLTTLMISCTSGSHKGPRFQVLDDSGKELFTELDFSCVKPHSESSDPLTKYGFSQFKGAPTEKFRQFTAENMGNQVKIVLCGKEVSIPVIQAEIKSGNMSFRLPDKAAEDCFRNISAETPACPVQ